MPKDTNGQHYFESFPNEGLIIGRMIDEGFFLRNPEHDGTEPPASMYFDKTDVQKFIREGYEPKVWTLIEGEDTLIISEGYHYVDRLEHLIEAPMTPERRRHLLSWRGLKKYAQVQTIKEAA